MKIVLLAHNSFSEYSYRLISPILEDKSLSIDSCIIYSPKAKSAKSKIKKHLANGRRGYILVIFAEKILKQIRNKINKGKTKVFNTENFFQENNVAIIRTTKLYPDDMINKLKAIKADLLILFEYHGIVKDKLIDIFPQGVLSYHYGDMRKYRGQPSVFWELYNNENETGVTVQKISTGIDNGEPIEEITLKIGKKETLKSMADRVEKLCPEMMYKAVKKVQDGYEAPQIKYGKLYTLPTLWQWLSLKFKLILR